ncbi:MAG: C69 family dipeptidase [Sandaracinaceae bacterium]|nr:C69 family dipeptidase [Sandaracinaceae bacterium]
MCDTMVARGAATADGATLFAKNSDRHPNEAQAIVRVEAREHGAGASVRCTYVEIPQVARTHAVILSKPFWMWGAEMGVNERGVAIGNEAVFTKRVMKAGAALLGMDLLRLGLERAASADEALSVITSLLEAHGQGGEAGYDGSLRYDNAFIIADADGAWVLETSGRSWVAERVEAARSISNALTIHDAGDLRGGVSPGADFAAEESDRVFTYFGAGRPRQARSACYLDELRGALRPSMLMAFLRSHTEPPDRFDPAEGVLGADVCMHAGYGPVRISHTTGSLVARLGPDGPRVWLTGTSTPCTSVFKPVSFEGPWPGGPEPTGAPDPSTLWWRHEAFARAVQRDHPTRSRLFAAERDALERALLDEDPSTAFARADEATASWRRRVEASPIPRRRRLFDRAWRRFERRARAHIAEDVSTT